MVIAWTRQQTRPLMPAVPPLCGVAVSSISRSMDHVSLSLCLRGIDYHEKRLSGTTADKFGQEPGGLRKMLGGRGGLRHRIAAEFGTDVD